MVGQPLILAVEENETVLRGRPEQLGVDAVSPAGQAPWLAEEIFTISYAADLPYSRLT